MTNKLLQPEPLEYSALAPEFSLVSIDGQVITRGQDAAAGAAAHRTAENARSIDTGHPTITLAPFASAISRYCIVFD